MSIKMMTWVFHDSPADLSPAQTLVLLALADAADDRGVVRYLAEEDRSQEALAVKCRMSRRTLQRAIAELVERELLEATRGPFVTDPLEYRILWRQNDATAQRQNGAARSDRMAQRTSIDGKDSVNAREPKRSRRKVAAHPIPDDWAPNPAHAALAAERGVDVQLEAATFRAHAESVDRRCVLWDAAFRQWLLKARATAPAAAAAAQAWPEGMEWMGLNR